MNRAKIFQVGGIVISLLGILAIFLAYRLPDVLPGPPNWNVVGFGTGAISVGVGFYATGVAIEARRISRESDKRMTAMANLEFYEKIAVTKSYLQNVIQGTIPSEPEAEKAYADRIYYDIKGAKQLKEWVKDPEIEKTLKKEIQNLLVKVLEGKTHKNLIKRLQQIRKEDC